MSLAMAIAIGKAAHTLVAAKRLLIPSQARNREH